MTLQRYRLIADELEAEIDRMAPGARLDSEHTLMRRFEVSRSAARAAVQELERRLRVRRVRGAGTFVANRIDYVISRDRPPSWHRTVRDAGARPRAVVLDITKDRLPAEPALRLGLPVGTPAHRMLRMSYIDDLVSGTNIEWIDADVVPEFTDAMRVEESLGEVLRQVGHVCAVRSWCRVASDVPPPDIRERLELATGVPAWIVESVSRDSVSGRPLFHSVGWMRGDAVRVVMEIGSTQSDTAYSASPTLGSKTKEVASS
ncbi:GntR family transcriptional regulator [Rhodococcus gannanensis]|uniref:GntR family transcriptional regulator n=1 Tax=Rhodococcus gannanensis TaxID=1960308 RepID=A0ABW4P441_9NOCA